MANPIEITKDSLMAVLDPPQFTADDNFEPSKEVTVIGRKQKINLGLEITGSGLAVLHMMIFTQAPVAPSIVPTAREKSTAASGLAGPRWTVSYFAESFGPGSNDVVLGTKRDFLDFNGNATKISQKETTAQVDLAKVRDADGNEVEIKPGIYKLTAVLEWSKSEVPALSSLPGFAAFIEGGTFQVIEE
jgi:hypothetical protein